MTNNPMGEEVDRDDCVTLILTRTDAQHAAHTLERGIGSPGWDKHSAAIAEIIRAALAARTGAK
jgi:hypothetical protein